MDLLRTASMDQAYSPNVFVAIDRTTFTVRAQRPARRWGLRKRPFELPDGSKLYALGGFHNGAVTVHVIGTDNFTIQKTLTFQDTSLGQEGISAGPYYPYALRCRLPHTVCGCGQRRPGDRHRQ